MKPARAYAVFHLSKLTPRLEESIYLWISIGIVYSLLLWPLLNSLCIITMFAFWLLFSNKQLPTNNIGRILLFVFPLLFLVAVAGMLNTSNMNEGLFRLQQKIPLLVFPLVFGTTTIITQRFLQKTLTHFVLATCVACGTSLVFNSIKYISTGDTELFSMPKLFLYRDGYPYIVGACCLTAIAICFSRLKTLKPAFVFLASSAVLLLSIYILLLSVRVIIVCWLIVFAINIFWLIKSPLTRFIISIILLATVITSIMIIPALNRQWSELTKINIDRIPLDRDASLGRSWGGGAIRLAIWESTENLRNRHWLTGVGTGDVQDSLQQAYRDRQFYFASEYNRYNSHNQFLQMLIGNGIAGVLILAACIVLPVYLMLRGPSDKVYITVILLFTALCVTEVILDINKGIVWYSYLNSIFAFTIFKSHRKSTQ